MTVDVRDLDIEGPDGAIPVRVFTPERSRGGLIVYMDAVGVRPELDGMCGEWAAQGYTTFLPDLFWRQGRLLTFPMPPQPGGALDPAMVAANLATTMDMTVADTRAILDRFGGEGTGRLERFGTVGYCMGARHALAAAAAWPDRVRFAACLHGGRMVWDGPDSPHLLISKVQGQLYLAFATDDDTCPDEHQQLLRETLAASGVRGEAQRFAAGHGWMFPDRWSWDEAAATAVKTRIRSAGDRGGLMIDLRQLEYFLKIAERRSFTAAAVELRITQPSLTKSIRLLEQDLGVQLFRRLPRGVELTQFGTSLARHARSVRVQVKNALGEIESLRQGVSGRITIGAGPSWLRRLLPRAIGILIEEHPLVRIQVVGGFDEALLRGLRLGEVDAAVVEIPSVEECADLDVSRSHPTSSSSSRGRATRWPKPGPTRRPIAWRFPGCCRRAPPAPEGGSTRCSSRGSCRPPTPRSRPSWSLHGGASGGQRRAHLHDAPDGRAGGSNRNGRDRRSRPRGRAYGRVHHPARADEEPHAGRAFRVPVGAGGGGPAQLKLRN